MQVSNQIYQMFREVSTNEPVRPPSVQVTPAPTAAPSSSRRASPTSVDSDAASATALAWTPKSSLFYLGVDDSAPTADSNDGYARFNRLCDLSHTISRKLETLGFASIAGKFIVDRVKFSIGHDT